MGGGSVTFISLGSGVDARNPTNRLVTGVVKTYTRFRESVVIRHYGSNQQVTGRGKMGFNHPPGGIGGGGARGISDYTGLCLTNDSIDSVGGTLKVNDCRAVCHFLTLGKVSPSQFGSEGG